MKTYLLLCLLLAVAPSYKHHNGNEKNNTDGAFTAKVNGKAYAGKNNHATLTINYAKLGVNVFTIESFSSSNALAAAQDEHFIFSLAFSGQLPQKGAYVLQDINFKKPFTTNMGKYDKGWKTGDTGSPADSKYSFAPARGGSGSIVITAINNNTVSGTFSGTAVNSKKEKIVVTNGTFNDLVIH